MVQRLGNKLRLHEGSRRDDKHRCKRRAEPLGGDDGPEVHLVAHDDIGPPLEAQLDDVIARRPASRRAKPSRRTRSSRSGLQK